VLHHLAGYGDVIVGNYSIHLWLLTPRGIIYLLLAGSIIFFTLILHTAGLLKIAHNSNQAALHAFPVLREILLDAHNLLKLSLLVFMVCLPFIPLVAIGPLVAKFIFLSKHDINFYLTRHPPEWYLTIGISALWVIPVLCVLFFFFIRSLYTLPVWLDGERRLMRANQISRSATQGLVWHLLQVGFICVGSWLAAMFLFDFILFSISKAILIHYIESINTVVRIVSAYIIIAAIGAEIISLLGLSWLACIWTLCYKRDVVAHKHATVRIEQEAKPPQNAKNGRLLLILTIAIVPLLFVGSGVLSTIIFKQEIPDKIPKIIAHRVGPAQSPENSLSGLKRVLQDGFADIVEIDVTLSQDGELVVAHDKDFMKQAGDPRIIRETTFDDLSEIDIGKMFSPDFKGEKIGRLGDFLKMVKGHIPIIIEFKHGHDSDLVEKTIKAVRDHEMQQQVIIMSLEIEEVRKVQKLAPEMKVGYFASVEVGDLRELSVYCLGAKDWMCSREFIREVQEGGVLVYAWTVDDPLRMVELIENGIDGIITNDPILTDKVINKINTLSPTTHLLLRFRKFWGVFDEMGWW